MPRWYLTHLVGRDGPKESDYYYQADAEVDLDLGAADRATCFGRALTIRFRPRELVWHGHLDDSNPLPGHGWPLESGNARLCLHNLVLLPKKFPPLGHPFEVGSTFDILSGESKIGTCTVTRVIDYTKQKIHLARPTK